MREPPLVAERGDGHRERSLGAGGFRRNCAAQPTDDSEREECGTPPYEITQEGGRRREGAVRSANAEPAHGHLLVHRRRTRSLAGVWPSYSSTDPFASGPSVWSFTGLTTHEPGHTNRSNLTATTPAEKESNDGAAVHDPFWL